VAKRAYPRKADEERRIVVSFSLSGVMLKLLRDRLEQYMHTEPTLEEVRSFARGKAFEAIEAYNAEPFVPEEE